MDDRFVSSQFPRSSGYHPEWVIAGVSGGANVLRLTEWLASALDLRPGMRVLDLGCGRALSSIFLHREFGVQVWATDLWFSATENLQRIRDACAGNNAPILVRHSPAERCHHGSRPSGRRRTVKIKAQFRFRGAMPKAVEAMIPTRLCPVS
jgi:predicted nicotinamide N-methyase